MISRIFSGLILIVMIRGAKSLIVVARLGHDLDHLVEDRHARRVRLAQALADDRLVDALDLDVHLQGGDAVARAGHLEVHVAEGILLAEDVGQDRERPSGSVMRPIAAPATGALIGTPASIRARVEPHVEAIDVEPFEVTHSRHEADDVRELLGGSAGPGSERPLGEVAVADVAPAGAAHRLVLAGAVRREVVVVEVALLGLRADRVDPLDVRGRAERRDGQRLRLAAREQARAVGARQQRRPRP